MPRSTCTMTRHWLFLWLLVAFFLFIHISAQEGHEDVPTKELFRETAYLNHTLFSVKVNGSDEVLRENFHRLCNSGDIDLWDDLGPKSSGVSEVIFRVSPPFLTRAEHFLNVHSLNHQVLTNNLQKWIEEETYLNSLDIVPRNGEKVDFDVSRYHRLDEIEQYLFELSSDYENTTELISIGKTADSRDIWLIKVRSEPEKRKPIVWIDAGIHAREWIAPASALYIIHRLVTTSEEDDEAKMLKDKFDWYFVPILNPDGYATTWTTDRFWRKNRSIPRTMPIRFPWTVMTDCIGTDLNRNFDISFGGAGTSGNPCSSSFRGDEPFSEQETWAVRNYLLEIKDSLKAYISLHSYSQMWMIPYAHTLRRSHHYQELMPLLRKVADAVKLKHGETYNVGPMSSLLYSAAGSSPDWVYEHLGIKYSFLVELRDRGRKGFLLPPSHIIPTGEELFEALKVIAHDISSTA